MPAEAEAIWKRLDAMREDHESLHRDHVQLKTLVGEKIGVLEKKIDENHAVRTQQHQELVNEIRTLAADSHERNGMVKLGRFAAAFIASVLGALGIYAWFHGGK